MIERLTILRLLPLLPLLPLVLLVAAACGDDTGTGGGGVGGDDPVVASASGVGGQAEGCAVGETIACQCRDGNAGTKLCTQNEIGETYFATCSFGGNPC